MIQLKEGQEIFDIKGNKYIVEKGDFLKEDEHYSDLFKYELLDNDWEQIDNDTFTKEFKGSISGGVLNPSGKTKVFLTFDSSARWIDIEIGFASTEFDGRNYIDESEKLVKDVELEIVNYMKGKKTKFYVKGK